MLRHAVGDRQAPVPRSHFRKTSLQVYKELSGQIRAIFAEHTPIIEPLSLDEAYLDVTENLQNIASATAIAQAIRAIVFEVTGLTASAGVSYNKFLAKLASEHRKPDGLFVVTPSMGPSFVEELPVGRFHGIGPVTVAKMEQLGIRMGADLRERSLDFLQGRFGKAGPYYYWISRGIDERPVRANRVRKSISAENTFSADLFGFDDMRDALQPILDKVWRHRETSGLLGPNDNAQVEVFRFPADHPQQIRRRADRVAPVARTDQSGASKTTSASRERRAASWSIPVISHNARNEPYPWWATRPPPLTPTRPRPIDAWVFASRISDGCGKRDLQWVSSTN